MSTLLLRLAAPLQSWGVDKFERRGTKRTPTKSGVIGLIAAAMGRRRNESIEDLQALRFGVRVDREGTLLRDFHMAHEERFWTTPEGKYSYITTRYYLADAVFLVGLEGDEALLAEIDRAVRHPAFPLFLGRRSCAPEGRLLLGIRPDKTLLEALREESWLVDDRRKGRMASVDRLRILMDVDQKDANAYFQRDVPLSFEQTHRRYGFRLVSEFEQDAAFTSGGESYARERPTEHDPVLELEG